MIELIGLFMVLAFGVGYVLLGNYNNSRKQIRHTAHK